MNFFTIYREELHKAVLTHPKDYFWYPTTPVDVVADRMIEAFKRHSYNSDGVAIRATCRRLGIKHTYKAINVAIADAQKEVS